MENVSKISINNAYSVNYIIRDDDPFISSKPVSIQMYWKISRPDNNVALFCNYPDSVKLTFISNWK